MAKQPKPKPRVNSDSLMLESSKKKQFAKQQESIAKAQIKKDGGNVPLRQYPYAPTGNERMQIAKKARQSASRDSAIAVQSKREKSTKPPVKSASKVAKTQKKIDKLMSKPKSKTMVGNAVRTIRTMALRSKLEK